MENIKIVLIIGYIKSLYNTDLSVKLANKNYKLILFDDNEIDNIKEIIHNINPYIIIYLYIDYNIINYKNINKYEIFCDMIDNQYNLYKINGNNTLQNIINTIMYIIK